MKVLVILAILLVLPGVAMIITAANPEVESGAHIAWEGDIGSAKCKARFHIQGGAATPDGNSMGFGNKLGGFVGIDNCNQLGLAVNVCDDNIDNNYECMTVGTVTSQCGGFCDER